MKESPGDRQWRALVARYGPPTPWRELSDDERRAAVRDRRALTMTVWRDGFGGGGVGCRLLETPDPEMGGDGLGRGIPVHFAFPPPCRLTPEIIRNLKRNGWENLRELPSAEE